MKRQASGKVKDEVLCICNEMENVQSALGYNIL